LRNAAKAESARAGNEDRPSEGGFMPGVPALELTLVIGRYALDYHLGGRQKPSLTETVRAWRGLWPAVLPLPHPSPRNNRWLKKNSWFEEEVLPALRARLLSLGVCHSKT
jgi:uracil-DNA glycosylase